ncbi:hypothetical protein AB6A40_007887 [Gnathostoma spinigerum]|uniref:Uncharacterized protein n=1 Tax=Gnathostoma spinigerum TaxID=75299 RepID=A0ABD6EVU8_9BILA
MLWGAASREMSPGGLSSGTSALARGWSRISGRKKRRRNADVVLANENPDEHERESSHDNTPVLVAHTKSISNKMLT